MNTKMVADRLGHAQPSLTLYVYAHEFEGRHEAAGVSIDSLVPKA